MVAPLQAARPANYRAPAVDGWRFRDPWLGDAGLGCETAGPILQWLCRATMAWARHLPIVTVRGDNPRAVFCCRGAC